MTQAKRRNTASAQRLLSMLRWGSRGRASYAPCPPGTAAHLIRLGQRDER